ncbi:HAD-IA family hydrolase [Treponema sp. OttesenSCG-928-L16]|nr:HAD-IA family hydrolase [Treponema sp. OttesenSCG-928-L16]
MLMIKHILFDLDNTLYSKSLKLEIGVEHRVIQFTADYLNISLEEAREERKKNVLLRYGTTIQWLTEEKAFTDIEGYYSFIHPENEGEHIRPDPELRRFIEGLPVPYTILTNSPMNHAVCILERLGVLDLFPRIIDIRRNGLVGKPHASAYRTALGAAEAEPETTLFIDDAPSYIEGYLRLGGRGILIDEFDEYQDWPHERIRKLEEIHQFFDVPAV